VVIQAELFNKTNIDSVVIAIATANLRLAKMPGNVSIPRGIAGFREDSVVNVTQLFTIDKTDLLELLGKIPNNTMEQINKGLRLFLSLPSGD
jgi:mRNA interferase MazF